LHNAHPIKIKVVIKVGGRDIFGAVFFYLYISTGNVKRSFDVANKTGVIITSTNNLETYSKIILND
jgi:fructose-1-phosphate kinase PfkB-like protein